MNHGYHQPARPDVNPQPPPPKASTPRPHGILSCDSCRNRKLRCDRQETCSNCITRAISCTYTLNGQPRPSSSKTARRKVNAHTRPIERVRRLEELVASLASDRHASAKDSASSGGSVRSDADPFATSSADAYVEGEESRPGPRDQSPVAPLVDKLGRLEMNNGQMVYLSAAHWATICDEITTIKDSLGDDPDLSEEDQAGGFGGGPVAFNGPLLMQGLTRPLTMEDVLQAIPSKMLADRLVYRYFAANDHSAVMYHVPTFQDEYNKFWMNPYAAPLAWVSLLFSIMTTAVALSLQAGDLLPDLPSDPMSTILHFHQRSTECLLLSHYWKPKAYTIEALLMNLQIEFIRSQDADLSVWTMAGTITRLAMSMGYHRDPAQYPQISCFHGEMRRRVWAGILQLDIFFSFQMGLPRMIVVDQCDTLAPRNLLDSDFNLDSTELPPARPEDQYTPLSYMISKGRLLAIFAEVASQSCSVQSRVYHQYLAFDKRLNEAYAAIPDHLRIPPRDAGVALTVPAPIIVRQHLLELLYQKTRCILHREYMIQAAHNTAFMYSRSACVDAAMSLLGQQVTIRQQVQEGGVLHRDRWLIMNSLHNTDFILAAMIVCLELSFRIDGDPRKPRLVDDLGRARYEDATLVQALRGSYHIWVEWKGAAKVSTQAARILSVMLRRAASRSTSGSGSGPGLTNDPLSDTTQVQHGFMGTAMDMQAQNGPDLGLGSSAPISRSNISSTSPEEGQAQTHHHHHHNNNHDHRQHALLTGGQVPNTSTEDIIPDASPDSNMFAIEDMIGSPGMIDWDLWETHMRNVSSGRDI